MKQIAVLLFFFSTLSLPAQLLNRAFERADGSTMLLGRITVDRLQQEPFASWFDENYSNYEVKDSILQIVELPDSITIFMGTWCGDSKREVPRFLKMLDHRGFDSGKVGIVALNTGFQNYKQAPEREESGMDIHRVPTFIFHDSDSNELGRIVEEPVLSLEQDTKDILNGKKYETYYPAANDLIDKLKNYPVDRLVKMRSELLKDYSGKAKSEYELNTYGYVLWSSFQLIGAEFVFDLNQKLFPDSKTVYYALCNIKSNLGKAKEAKKVLKEGIKRHPDDERLQEMWSSI
ncbi:MAG: hypothetical protein AAF789_03795 [Bacteroidota bacterium]